MAKASYTADTSPSLKLYAHLQSVVKSAAYLLYLRADVFAIYESLNWLNFEFLSAYNQTALRSYVIWGHMAPNS